MAEHAFGGHMDGHGHEAHFGECCSGHGFAHGAHEHGADGPGTMQQVQTNQNAGKQNYKKGRYIDVPAFQRHFELLGQKTTDEETLVALPGIRHNDRRVEILVWPHRQFDVKTKVRQLAALCGLYDLAAVTNGMAASDQILEDKLSLEPLSPAGSYPGATGSTRVWTEYWKIPLKKAFRWPWQKEPDPGPIYSYLIISGFTWHFTGTDDYETQVAFYVYTPFEEGTGFPYKADEVKAHRRVAGEIADRLYASLSLTSPDIWSVQERCRIADRQSQLKKQALLQAQEKAAPVKQLRRSRLP